MPSPRPRDGAFEGVTCDGAEDVFWCCVALSINSAAGRAASTACAFTSGGKLSTAR